MQFVKEQVAEVTILMPQITWLDASNVPQFKDAIQPHLTDKLQLIIDLTPVDFMDSSGLGAMLSVLKKVDAAHGELKLCGMSRKVRALFELVRMHRIFEIYNNREEALKSFEGGMEASS